MNEQLDSEYLEWLYSQVGNPNFKNPKRTYWSLFRQLYLKEFIWLIANDDNRVEDGRELKLLFLEESGIRPRDGWAEEPGCSFLEVLIALSSHLAFELDSEVGECFWHLMDNIGLREFNDMDYDTDRIDELVDRVIWRNYKKNGRGGLFPLRNPHEDQTKVELWYQMNAYVQEQV